MIGRYADLNIYEEIFKSTDFYKVFASALLIPIAMLFSSVGISLNSSLMVGDIILLLSVLINGLPIIMNALKGIAAKQINVDELVSIAIIACVLSANFLEAAIVSAIMVVGTLVEEAVSDSARNAIKELIEITPKTAVVERDGIEVKVKVSKIILGEILLIKAGETISVDGKILHGSTSVDESSITGESIPVFKDTGSRVYAGTQCLDGYIKVEAQRLGRDSTLGKIITMIKSAEQSRIQATRIVDIYAKWFTPVILSVAILTYLITSDVTRAITILIVGCPCSFLLAGPVATVAAIGRAAKSGILVKGGHYLESIATATGFFFDKTGTITEGQPVVVDVIPHPGFNDKEIIGFAAAVEAGSLHPFAQAIISKAKELDCDIPNADNLFSEAGKGVSGNVGSKKIQIITSARYGDSGNTTVCVSIDGDEAGYISLRDKPRATARQTIQAIRNLGISDIAIVSGDQEKPVKKVADGIDVSTWYSCQKPGDKLNIIESYSRGGLVYVGDGVNDAPALKASATGVAMGFNGSDVALETADVVLMNDRLDLLPFLITLSRKMSKIIKTSIFLSFAINAFAVAAGSAGLLTPIMGAVTHNMGSILVVALSASIRFTPDSIS